MKEKQKKSFHQITPNFSFFSLCYPWCCYLLLCSYKQAIFNTLTEQEFTSLNWRYFVSWADCQFFYLSKPYRIDALVIFCTTRQVTRIIHQWYSCVLSVWCFYFCNMKRFKYNIICMKLFLLLFGVFMYFDSKYISAIEKKIKQRYIILVHGDFSVYLHKHFWKRLKWFRGFKMHRCIRDEGCCL